MSIVEVSEVVNAPPEVVWDVVADPRNLSLWDAHIYEVRGVPETGLEPGTEYTTGLRFMGARAHVLATVLELEPERYSKVRLHGLVDGTVETWLEPAGDGKTLLLHRVVFRFRGGPIGAMAARAVGVLGAPVLLRRGIQAQKRQAERLAR